ncbi:MAG: UDP-N-acetylmuramoyl-L-alanine--D-glutamate ligase [Schaedlerella sp.]|nr:UDP-N-acetylmuramoyl-L-alanine--D-glutamate ligase [Lachnospiraceae bacterium]MDY4202814.1 UDP-N-acetylmuramoyl-L-alanine--D-glutamate ligase [Schaedlerella sp.]
MDFKGKKVLVFGSGISGIASAGLLINKDAYVILYDGNASLDADKIRMDILSKNKNDDRSESGLQVILGEFPAEIINELDLLVISPGVPADLPIVEEIKGKGIPVWGEIELAYVCGRGDVLAITGTNGKTTTTALLGEIMKNYRENTFVVGNIGIPYAGVAGDTTEDSIIVAEMSSFQLETIHTFAPRVGAILNITPDHLNRHHTMQAYIDAKKNITGNQTEKDICVLNYEDEVTRKIGEEIRAKVLYFSSRRKLERGICLENGDIIYRNPEPVKICNVEELQILGTHNHENVMAASAMALAYSVPVEIVRDTVCAFGGVEHRIEFVAEKNGVAYYNDSKGTNPDAAIKGIGAMNRPTVLIGGGYDKDSSYEEWIRSFDGKVKKLVLIGATREKIEETAKRLGFYDTVLADTFEEAVELCVKFAEPGDAVLLSPACASWGMFRNYEERGDKFKELVNQL